jgi:hypothetical protein
LDFLVRAVPSLIPVDERNAEALRGSWPHHRRRHVDRRRSDADQFLQANAASFAIVYDDHGATPLAYSVQGMPSSYLIDAHGTVVAIEQGFRDDRRNALEDRIRSLLANR